MMRLAKKEDISQVILNWQESFGDTREEIEEFFSAFDGEARICIWEESGQVAGQLILLPVNLHLVKFQESEEEIGEITDISVEYIYAVATKENFRGKGICTRLLEGVFELLKKENKPGILVPANEELCVFYEKRGFVNCFHEEKIAVTNLSGTCIRDNMTRVSTGKNKPFYSELDALSYLKIRQEAFGKMTYVDLPQKMLSFAVKEHCSLGGKCVQVTYNQKSYGVMYRELNNCDKEVLILEITCDNVEETREVAEYMLAVSDNKTAQIRRSYKTYGINLPEGFYESGIFNLVLA